MASADSKFEDLSDADIDSFVDEECVKEICFLGGGFIQFL